MTKQFKHKFLLLLIPVILISFIIVYRNYVEKYASKLNVDGTVYFETNRVINLEANDYESIGIVAMVIEKAHLSPDKKYQVTNVTKEYEGKSILRRKNETKYVYIKISNNQFKEYIRIYNEGFDLTNDELALYTNCDKICSCFYVYQRDDLYIVASIIEDTDEFVKFSIASFNFEDGEYKLIDEIKIKDFKNSNIHILTNRLKGVKDELYDVILTTDSNLKEVKQKSETEIIKEFDGKKIKIAIFDSLRANTQYLFYDNKGVLYYESKFMK